ncbi:hypothetical protein NDI76_18970 [Halogeometricum sp. S1BR25-6]|uniref:Phage holin family protein n=1 Tax=Halogeometricum salsisoli TaxID=2950536 RepID=A0ABU2GJ54_9EURY|nr:hypothetical protein [Halogeometricum sp. S1BR25-6]MDS0300835.1 hypothetical protein [Halogeometricum sp. S1BR25-6]
MPDEPDGSASDGDPDAALRVATTEARRTLDQQLDTLEDIDRKAMRLLRFSVGLLGVVVSVLSLTDGTVGLRSMPYLGGGLAFLVVGAVAAGVTYTASPRVAGASPADLERAAETDSERAFRRTLVRSYADWIRFNAAANARAALLITVAILFVVAGAVGLALGSIQALTGPLPPVVVAVAGAGLLLAAYLAGVHRQFFRLREAERRDARRGGSSDSSGTPDVPDATFTAADAGAEARFEGQLCHTGDVGTDRGRTLTAGSENGSDR